jgi:Cu-processing system ATP-binding protein
MQAALAPIAGVELTMNGHLASISCMPAQKLAVLEQLFALKGKLQDIAIHEPSLEDLFLGYGGSHVAAR